jgi:hypothetical protein
LTAETRVDAVGRVIDPANVCDCEWLRAEHPAYGQSRMAMGADDGMDFLRINAIVFGAAHDVLAVAG